MSEFDNYPIINERFQARNDPAAKSLFIENQNHNEKTRGDNRIRQDNYLKSVVPSIQTTVTNEINTQDEARLKKVHLLFKTITTIEK